MKNLGTKATFLLLALVILTLSGYLWFTRLNNTKLRNELEVATRPIVFQERPEYVDSLLEVIHSTLGVMQVNTLLLESNQRKLARIEAINQNLYEDLLNIKPVDDPDQLLRQLNSFRKERQR